MNRPAISASMWMVVILACLICSNEASTIDVTPAEGGAFVSYLTVKNTAGRTGAP
jgi:hypothetical protein